MNQGELKKAPSVRSIDPDEVAYYDRLADTWWDTSGPFWPLHKLNGFRVDYIRERLLEHYIARSVEKPLNGVSVLDIGCGGGLLSEAMARLGADVHGVDVVERNILVARRHAAREAMPVRYDWVSAETLASQGARYDVVLNMEVVEHVAHLVSFLDASISLVKPGGVMFVATINRNPIAWLTAIVGAEYILRWLPRGTHQYRKLRKPAEVTDCLEAGGCQVVHRTGVAMNPVTRRFRYTRAMPINYMLTAVKAV